MKKSSFIALIMGTAAGMLFALGMCMTLLPEWNAFPGGVVLVCIGVILGIATLIAWYRREQKKLPKINGKSLFRITYAVFGVLVLGLGMCLCLVWQKFVWGTIVGLIGIILLLGLIPMVKGLK